MKLKNKSKKEQKGITLIALVITIIVLLILAGVSIAMITGNNGILTQANDSKEETTLAERREKLKLLQQEAYMEEYNNAKTELTEEEATDLGWTENGYLEYSGNESTIYIPSKVGKKETNLFMIKDNSEITKIVVPGDIKDLSNCKFSNLPNLEVVILKEGISKTGQIMFNNCKKLEYLTLPSTLTEIQGFAFEASNIKDITIPKSVTTIGTGIFGWCENPATIHCEVESKPTGWNDDWLKYAPEGTTVDWGYTR